MSLCEAKDKTMAKTQIMKDTTPTFPIEPHETNEALRLLKVEGINFLESQDLKVDSFYLFICLEPTALLSNTSGKLSTEVRNVYELSAGAQFHPE